MGNDELEQDADDFVHHEAQALGAAPALAILQEQLLGVLAAIRQNELQPLCHRAPEILLGAGVFFGEL